MNDEIKRVYEDSNMVDYYNHLTKFMQVINSEKIIFDKYIKENDRILDVGCGTGRTTIYLYEKGYNNIVGIDISSRMIEIAKQNNSAINFINSDIMSYSDEDLFDVAIFSFNGLMLIKTFEQRSIVTRNIYQLLKPGGLFIFSTPFLDNKYEKHIWKSRLNQDKNKPGWEFGDIYIDDSGVDNIYLHIPFKKEIYSLIRKSGFTLEADYRRLDICQEPEEIEAHLDDNIYWIARK